ncbi:hypothetical protein JOE61_003846 [Nocardioides salarius]|uniref:Uncharacterized protein n=1 Tax=Nocardioides salarius TaxID=374513 RepID=A0ABS2MFY6_9ACTN|nr:hypothetical protein [Nocardioides salarius]
MIALTYVLQAFGLVLGVAGIAIALRARQW